MSIQAEDGREQVAVMVPLPAERTKETAEWRRRFPQLDFLRVVEAERAGLIFARLAPHIAWAWLCDHDEWTIVWVGDRLEAKIFPYGAAEDSFTQVPFEDFIRFYGLKIVDEGEPSGYLVPARRAS